MEQVITFSGCPGESDFLESRLGDLSMAAGFLRGRSDGGFYQSYDICHPHELTFMTFGMTAVVAIMNIGIQKLPLKSF